MFFTYSQNNSGGGFDYDETRGIGEYVIVEADSADEADARAERIGLYFDGTDANGDHIDCECCGDRWYRAFDDGDRVPSISGTPIWEAYNIIEWTDGYSAFIHIASGRIVRVHLPKGRR